MQANVRVRLKSYELKNFTIELPGDIPDLKKDTIHDAVSDWFELNEIEYFWFRVEYPLKQV